MNNAIAYGSGGAPSLKSLYDSENLRIFNRVGTTNHSRDHDAAQKQIASYSNITDMEADGVFGHLVKNANNSIDVISWETGSQMSFGEVHMLILDQAEAFLQIHIFPHRGQWRNL